MSSSTNRPLGFIEVRHLSIAAIVADTVTKSANVHLLGLEPAGTELTLIRISGDSPADVQSALDEAHTEAARLGGEATTTMMANPDPNIPSLNEGDMIINGLYGGREELKPTDYQPNKLETNTTMSKPQKAIGILETQGLTASLEATDAMLKAADVSLVGKEKIGAAYVTIIIEGDVAAVKAAIDTGAAAVGDLGKLIAAHVIARPHNDLIALLPG
ncbi:MAG: BMC domain-containing protein [Akkermansiaceae bacterium]|nr:BMC domain-containing protein [Akkermansiaceae bacterium]